MWGVFFLAAGLIRKQMTKRPLNISVCSFFLAPHLKKLESIRALVWTLVLPPEQKHRHEKGLSLLEHISQFTRMKLISNLITSVDTTGNSAADERDKSKQQDLQPKFNYP